MNPGAIGNGRQIVKNYLTIEQRHGVPYRCRFLGGFGFESRGFLSRFPHRSAEIRSFPGPHSPQGLGSSQPVGGHAHQIAGGEADIAEGFAVSDHKVLHQGVFFHPQDAGVVFDLVEHPPD